MKTWTQKEDKLLKQVVASQTNLNDVCKSIGLSKHLVKKRMNELGLVFKLDEIKLTQIKQADKSYRKKFENAVSRITELEKLNDLNNELKGQPIKTYKIVSSKSESDGGSEATAIVLLSDWHYEENVKSQQVNGLNSFNREIAKQRIEKLFKVIARLIKVHKNEYSINTLVLALLGDFISGSIHDDLKEGNDIQPTQAIYEVQCLIASGIKYLLQETNIKLVIPCSTGNHGRITEKIRVSTSYGNSLEFLMYNQLRDYFENEERVHFIINDSYLTYMEIYEYKARFHHGDAIRYGGGIGGLFIPAFKAISQWNKSKYADWDFFGHFHQLKDGGNFITNGSLIGFNSYAIRIKADYEKPKQAFVVIDKERGFDVVRKITL